MVVKVSVRSPVKSICALLISITVLTLLVQRERTSSFLKAFKRTGVSDKTDVQEQFSSGQKKESHGHVKAPIPIILLTYMRSGSSFLGNVLQANPDVFYLFEPLHAIQFAVRDRETFTFLNGTARKYDNFLEVAKLTIAGLATCEMESLPIKTWFNGFFVFSKKAKGTRYCVSMAKTLSESRACVNVTKKACHISSHSAFKTIRIPMDLLEDLMKSIPNLHIIHLLRDPRATILSQKAYGVIPAMRFRQYVTAFCDRVYKDVVSAERFRTLFPDRIMRIFYEDIAKDPKGYAKSIYNFTDMKYTTKIDSEIHSMTYGKVPEDCGQLCARKSNSTAQAEAWRKGAALELVDIIDNGCQPLYLKLGYRNIESERMLRDIKVPLRNSISTFDDFRYA